MPTDAQQIATIKSQALANIAEITTSPKPTYTIDGQTVSWTEYLKQLQTTVEWCNSQEGAASPAEIVTQAYS